MGQPNRDSLSNSRSKKFSWDSQTAIRLAIHGLKNFHGTAKPRFAEQFTVTWDLVKFKKYLNFVIFAKNGNRFKGGLILNLDLD
jgi:hypothetical protein